MFDVADRYEESLNDCMQSTADDDTVAAHAEMMRAHRSYMRSVEQNIPLICFVDDLAAIKNAQERAVGYKCDYLYWTEDEKASRGVTDHARHIKSFRRWLSEAPDSDDADTGRGCDEDRKGETAVDLEPLW